MKVTVSIPDEIFVEAEALAKRWRTSRSEIFSRALGEFIGRHAPDRVSAELDSFRAEANRRVFEKTEW